MYAKRKRTISRDLFLDEDKVLALKQLQYTYEELCIKQKLIIQCVMLQSILRMICIIPINIATS